MCELVRWVTKAHVCYSIWVYLSTSCTQSNLFSIEIHVCALSDHLMNEHAHAHGCEQVWWIHLDTHSYERHACPRWDTHINTSKIHARRESAHNIACIDTKVSTYVMHLASLVNSDHMRTLLATVPNGMAVLPNRSTTTQCCGSHNGQKRKPQHSKTHVPRQSLELLKC